MRFKSELSQPICTGDLTYIPDDYSFQFRPLNCEDAITSIVVNDLQLQVNANGRVLWAVGLCPHTSWLDASLAPPPAYPGLLIAMVQEELVPGVSLRLTSPGGWPMYADPRSGWVSLGDPERSEGEETVEFATSSLAVLRSGELAAIWLHPNQFPKRRGRLGRLFSRWPA